MDPPKLPAWNLGLRFGLELVALFGLGAGAWSVSGGLRWVAAFGVPLIAAGIWGAFNVRDDPSRSGRAPVEVPGPARLVIELGILAFGATGLAVAGHTATGAGFVALTLLHYAASIPRIRWLLLR